MAPLMLTPDAQREMDRYLRRVNLALRARPGIDAEDVEREIRGHITYELAEKSTPVNEAQLRDVLDRLGSPTQWVPIDDLRLWRRLLVEMRSPSQDWRLAFLTFVLFFSGALTAPAGLVLLVASIPTARATLALLEEQGEPVGARRWLVYPPLVLTYLVLVVGVFVVAPALAATAGDPTVRVDAQGWLPEPFWLGLALVVATVAGLWWAVLGSLLMRFTRSARMLCWPFAEWFERRHAIWLALGGSAIALFGGMGLGVIVWAL